MHISFICCLTSTFAADVSLWTDEKGTDDDRKETDSESTTNNDGGSVLEAHRESGRTNTEVETVTVDSAITGHGDDDDG